MQAVDIIVKVTFTILGAELSTLACHLLDSFSQAPCVSTKGYLRLKKDATKSQRKFCCSRDNREKLNGLQRLFVPLAVPLRIA